MAVEVAVKVVKNSRGGGGGGGGEGDQKYWR